jgi:hypothetical protein
LSALGRPPEFLTYDALRFIHDRLRDRDIEIALHRQMEQAQRCAPEHHGVWSETQQAVIFAATPAVTPAFRRLDDGAAPRLGSVNDRRRRQSYLWYAVDPHSSGLDRERFCFRQPYWPALRQRLGSSSAFRPAAPASEQRRHSHRALELG